MEDFWCLFFLYPEIHYRFKYFPFSLYYKSEPEILLDLPHKTLRGKSVPVLLFIKDADRFPVFIENIEFCFYHNQKLILNKIVNIDRYISDHYFDKIFRFSLQESGWCDLRATINYRIKNSSRQVINDNFGYKNNTLTTYLNDNELQTLSTSQGDIHTHSLYTEDQLEFGASLEAIKEFSLCLGLNFVCITDHSYDLDDEEGEVYNVDVDLKKVHKLQKECVRLSKNKFMMINSIEISARNSRQQNVHLLNINNSRYIKGSGDSGEKIFCTRGENSINSIVSYTDSDTLNIAAHPFARASFLERLFLNRGRWEAKDLEQLQIWQILNGDIDIEFLEGLKYWSKMLLMNKKIFICAGNDSHGNFSCFRQVKLPMFKLIKRNKQVFGKCKTVVFGNIKTKEDLIDKIRHGKSYITSGPHVDFSIKDIITEKGTIYHPGSVINLIKGETYLDIKVQSSKFSGYLKKIIVYYGSYLDKKEYVIFEQYIDNKNTYNFNHKSSINLVENMNYLRMEVETISYTREMAVTNPIYINFP